MVTPEHYNGISTCRFVYLTKVAVLAGAVTLAFVGGCARSQRSGLYEVMIPAAWKSDLSVGKLTVVDSAFYGVPWHLGLFPVVRLNLPVENLTSDALYFKVNYRTEGKKKGFGNSGMGVAYTLGPREKRVIDTIVPIGSVTRPIRFKLRMGKPSHSLDKSASAETVVVMIDPFKVLGVAAQDVQLTNVESEDCDVEQVQLAHSKDQGNHLLITVRNKSHKNLLLGTYVAVNDPMNIENKGVLARPRGFFSELVETIPAKNTPVIKIPYKIPPVGPDPVLVFTLFNPHKDSGTFGEHDRRRWDVRLVCYGSFNLRRAAERAECVIPEHAPVEERARLTAQMASEHFLFRYRPGSYAERNIEKIIKERQEAYERLSSVLQMELPATVTIDLYPDMDAKALGSGTTWTPCNTRTNKHICEVYDESYQCDAYHELAHIFSYHFPDYRCNQGGLVEAFAAYFEPHNMPIPETRETLRRSLHEGKMDPLGEVLLSGGSSQELVIAIDFLLTKDTEKFKKLYVSVTCAKASEDLEKATQDIYGTNLKELDAQWKRYIEQSG
ncbi:MAG: hypothetical protein ACYTEX_14450 [Planctomycetota bacterium]|jgi:hypothetical protein